MVSLFATLHVFAHKSVERLRREETGATAVEYGLMVGIISIVLIAAVTLFGGELKTIFSDLIPDNWKTGGTAPATSGT